MVECSFTNLVVKGSNPVPSYDFFIGQLDFILRSRNSITFFDLILSSVIHIANYNFLLRPVK